MDQNRPLPRSPFTTRLSGSARETELRIRSIFQWNKKRPPAALVVLVLASILLCGNLVACRVKDIQTEPSNQQVLEALYEVVADRLNFLDGSGPRPLEKVSASLLDSATHNGYTLGSARFQDSFDVYLVIGVVEEATNTLAGPAYVASAGDSSPHSVIFQPDGAYFSQDGAQYLLYTCNGMSQGFSQGEAGLIRFDGEDLVWVWPVEGDVRDAGSQAFADYQDYWEDHLALMAPGGVDVFSENPDYGPYNGSPPQWTAEHNELFYPTPEEELPMPVYYQTRVWLEEFSRYQHNSRDLVNASADWRILSLTPNSWIYPDQADDRQGYTLLAQADGDDGLYLGAHLVISEESGTVVSAHQYVQGDYDLVVGKLAEYDDSARQQPEDVDALPIPQGQGLMMTFCSGAGAWQTSITLNGDGTFTGEYRDDDMGLNTAYVCSFRGRFGHLQRLTDYSYSMTLDELELTTGYPVDREWTENGTRYVSSQPYGLDGGHEFRFYTPAVPTMELPEYFLLWFNGVEKDRLLARTGALGYYGLYNKEMEYGFYSS